jgi:hypothetical protein
MAAVPLRDRDDEAQVRVDHPLLGSRVAALDALRERDLLRCGQQRVAADLGQEQLQRVGGRREARGLGGAALELGVGVRGGSVGVLVGSADLDPAVLEGAGQLLDVLRLELVALDQRLDLGRLDEAPDLGLVQQLLSLMCVQQACNLVLLLSSRSGRLPSRSHPCARPFVQPIGTRRWWYRPYQPTGENDGFRPRIPVPAPVYTMPGQTAISESR